MEVTAEQLKQVSEKLRGCPQQVNAALTNAANRAMMTARRVAWDAVHKQYTIKKTEFYRKTSIRTYRANKQSLGATVEFGGYVIPLINFGVESYRSHEKSRIRRYKVEVFRGIPKDLWHAYVTNLGRYGTNVFERVSSGKRASQTLYGPSAAHMVENGEVLAEMNKAAKATFDNRLEHEVDRILRGLGGKGHLEHSVW